MHPTSAARHHMKKYRPYKTKEDQHPKDLAFREALQGLFRTDRLSALAYEKVKKNRQAALRNAGQGLYRQERNDPASYSTNEYWVRQMGVFAKKWRVSEAQLVGVWMLVYG